MLNNNYDQRLAQTEDGLVDLLQMNLAVNYPQWLYSMIKPFIRKKVLEALACVGNETNKIISDVEQLITVDPHAAYQKEFQIKLFDKIVSLISLFEDKVNFPIGLSLVSVSRKEK